MAFVWLNGKERAELSWLVQAKIAEFSTRELAHNIQTARQQMDDLKQWRKLEKRLWSPQL